LTCDGHMKARLQGPSMVQRGVLHEGVGLYYWRLAMISQRSLCVGTTTIGGGGDVTSHAQSYRYSSGVTQPNKVSGTQSDLEEVRRHVDRHIHEYIPV
jgi:hypothetical protein